VFHCITCARLEGVGKRVQKEGWKGKTVGKGLSAGCHRESAGGCAHVFQARDTRGVKRERVPKGRFLSKKKTATQDGAKSKTYAEEDHAYSFSAFEKKTRRVGQEDRKKENATQENLHIQKRKNRLGKKFSSR